MEPKAAKWLIDCAASSRRLVQAEGSAGSVLTTSGAFATFGPLRKPLLLAKGLTLIYYLIHVRRHPASRRHRPRRSNGKRRLAAAGLRRAAKARRSEARQRKTRP